MNTTLEYLINRYKVDLNQPSPIRIPAGRNKCLPNIYRDLGFKVGAEIGVHRGVYAQQILKRIPNLKLYCIDLWDNYTGYTDYRPDQHTPAYLEAQERTKGFDCTLIKNWSHEAVKDFADESLDYVYIDGNHTFEYVVQDIALWSKKVRTGGLVCGHDYHDFSKSHHLAHVNIINAVDGWCKSYRIHPLFVLANNSMESWMYVK